MIKTVRLAGYELRRFKGPLPILALLFLLLVPSVVGGLYLWSNWDPYGRTDQVPVAVVNQDVSVEVEGQTIDAGDRLVTELQGDPIFQWNFVDEDRAEAGLADGSYYMIVTIPPDFSENLISGAGDTPERAVIEIFLNDANGYLMELLADSARSRLEAAIDRAAVGAYFESVFANLDTIRIDVTAAASSAAQLSATANGALTGATEISTAVSTAKQGSSLVVSGLADSKAASTQLVTSLSTATSESAAVASGLGTIDSTAAEVSSGASDVAAGTSQLASSLGPAISDVNAAVQPIGQADADLSGVSGNLTTIAANLTALAQTPGLDPAVAAEINTNVVDITTVSGQTTAAANLVSAGFDSIDSASSALSGLGAEATSVSATAAQVSAGAGTVSTGLSTASSGASSLDSTLAGVSTDATTLDTGIGNLQLGAQQLDDGLTTAETGSLALLDQVTQIDAGAGQLATDLAAVGERIPTLATDELDNTEQVLSSPADVKVTIDNPAEQYGRGLAPLFFAIAIWVFGIAVFLVMRPISARALAGRASSWRVAIAGWLPIVGIAALGSLLLLGIVWATLGLDPVNIGGSIGVVILAAVCFTAITHLLRTWLGGAGSAIALVLLMLQFTASGGLYPIETTPAPFRAIHDFLPMSYLVDALRITFTGGPVNRLWVDVAVLAGFAIVAVGLCVYVVHRRRRFRLRDLHPVLA